MNATAEKAELRRRLLEARVALSEDERAERDSVLSDILLSSPLFDGVSTVYLYAAVRGEIDLSAVAERLDSGNIALAYPITERAGVMHFHLSRPRELIPGRYGIPEPPPTAPEAISDPRSICLVPALAYDEYGYRIGYGGGYYDRFLMGFEGISIGIAENLSDFEIPHEAHDRAVDYLLTRSGLRKVSQSEVAK